MGVAIRNEMPNHLKEKVFDIKHAGTAIITDIARTGITSFL